MADEAPNAEQSAETGGDPNQAQAEREQAAVAALKIVNATAAEPTIQEYMILKRLKFHERGMDPEWLVIAEAVGAWPIVPPVEPPPEEPVTAQAEPISNP
jgi:hypothetical protein